MSVVERAKDQLLSNGSWSVAPARSTVEFRVRHMMFQTVHGRFRDFEGSIVAGDDPYIVGSINVASLGTLNDERDAHLCSPDFFDVERFPAIRFRAVGLHFDRDGRHFALPGELTIKGVTRPFLFAGELRGSVAGDEYGEWLALEVRGQVDRSDFGLVWNRTLETGGMLVGDTVDLTLDVAAVRVD
jgi:polyisoprenoid-binding protein YceI